MSPFLHLTSDQIGGNARRVAVAENCLHPGGRIRHYRVESAGVCQRDILFHRLVVSDCYAEVILLWS